MKPRGPVGTDRPLKAHMCIYILCLQGQMLIGMLIGVWSDWVRQGLVKL